MTAHAPCTRFDRLARIGLALLWCALLAGLLGRYAWPLELFSHFRLHYCVLFLVLVVAAGASRRWRVATLALAGALLSAAPVAAYVRGAPSSSPDSGRFFRLVSFNIWFRTRDVEPIARFLLDADADVIVLQEALPRHVEPLRVVLLTHPHVHADPDRHGAVIFSRWPITAQRLALLAPGGAYANHVQIAWRDASIDVLGVHLHWPLAARAARLRNEELASLMTIARNTSGPLLIAGDFNAAPWSPVLRDALAGVELQDCARGRSLEPSWPSHLLWLGIRIDHCLASPDWRVQRVDIGPHLGSDHRPVIVDLALVRTSE